MTPVMTSKDGIHPMPSSRRMGAWLQIVEGTNQIQRLVIGRSLARDPA